MTCILSRQLGLLVPRGGSGDRVVPQVRVAWKGALAAGSVIAAEILANICTCARVASLGNEICRVRAMSHTLFCLLPKAKVA